MRMLLQPSVTHHPARSALVLLLLAMALAAGARVEAAGSSPTAKADEVPAGSSKTVTGPPLTVIVNKSTILRLDVPATRISVANPAVADITPINSREIYVLGKSIGTTNLIIWNKTGVATMIDVNVTAEPTPPTSVPVPEDKEPVEVIKGLNKSILEF
jgi:pilus assembly protein CpaC